MENTSELETKIQELLYRVSRLERAVDELGTSLAYVLDTLARQDAQQT